jgi:hypothetical protein
MTLKFGLFSVSLGFPYSVSHCGERPRVPDQSEVDQSETGLKSLPQSTWVVETLGDETRSADCGEEDIANEVGDILDNAVDQVEIH